MVDPPSIAAIASTTYICQLELVCRLLHDSIEKGRVCARGLRRFFLLWNLPVYDSSEIKLAVWVVFLLK